MLSALQRELKSLVGDNRTDELFRRLTVEVLRADGELFNLATTLQASYRAMGQANIEGIISFAQGNLQFNSVNKGLLYLIDQLRVDQLHPDLRQRADRFLSIPDYHAYGVNRSEQAAKFEEDQWLGEDPDCKVHFYYLYGDLRQETHSLVKRLGLELSGPQLSADALELQAGRRIPLMVECKPEARPRLEIFRIMLLKSLIEKFVGPVNNMRNLREKTLLDLLDSPKLAHATADDIVCITVRLDHHNWDAEIVPRVLRDLFETFCRSELPATSPRFYFFFGMEYPKDKPQLRAEVATAVANRRYGEELPELEPVTRAEIADWFSRHAPMLPPGTLADEVARQHFPDAEHYDMLDVEVTLQRLIDLHNKGLILDNS